MDPTAITLDLAPSPSTSTKFAPLLEAHLGVIVAAVAGVIGEGVAEYQNGGLTTQTKGQSAKFLCELVRLREFMISDYPDFDRIARERGARSALDEPRDDRSEQDVGGALGEDRRTAVNVRHYIAVVHKDKNSDFGISFSRFPWRA